MTVARGLHKTIIAECVEDEATLVMLKGFGVDSVQGYYLEKPRVDHPLLISASRLQNTNLEMRFDAP